MFIWLRNDVHADILDLAVAIHQRLSAVAKVEFDLPGFVYRDSRDLISFVDGTANPKDDARFDAALIPDGDAGAGGAYVFSQKWVHDLGAFNALGVDEQEKVVGRTKTDDIELEGDALAKAKRNAFLASRTNAWLAIPMLIGMIAANHGGIMAGF